MPVITTDRVSKYYTISGKGRIAALKNVSLTVNAGEFVFITGSSGAGKTTLLHLISTDIRPDEGAVYWGKQDIGKFRKRQRALLRRQIGQVWQEPHLLLDETVRVNLELASCAMGTMHPKRISERIEKALAIVGMSGVQNKYPASLSGGEVKLVELARALLNSPPVLLLDEITANLDHDTGWDIMTLLDDINRRGTTIIMATHARDFVNIMCKRVVTLVDGVLRGDVKKGRYGDLS